MRHGPAPLPIARAASIVALALGATASHAQSADGTWASEGYGYVFELKGQDLQAYEVTRISCQASFKATRADDAPAGADAAFRMGGSMLLLLPGRNATTKRFHQNGAASDIIIRRIAARPATCDQPAPNTPTSNFEIFARTWAEQYGFFDIKGVKWSDVVATNRPKVTDATTPDELFEIFKTMIEPLEDAHTGIGARALSKNFGGFRKGPNRLTAAERPRAYEIVEKEYLKAPIHSYCNGIVQFGMLADSIGYLRIKAFGGYTADGAYESGLVALDAALDSMLSTPGMRGLVIDVRLNNGGADPYGLAIASRLTTSPYVAYAKQARLDPDDASKWTEPQVSTVRPSGRPGFKGAIVELTGLHSVSAAETFTQALLHRTPKVTRVGENTQGVFSDVLGRQLPNGWRFRLPNERFVTDGKAYDGPGIAPDVAVPVFPKEDLEQGRDRALEKALEILRVKR